MQGEAGSAAWPRKKPGSVLTYFSWVDLFAAKATVETAAARVRRADSGGSRYCSLLRARELSVSSTLAPRRKVESLQTAGTASSRRSAGFLS